MATGLTNWKGSEARLSLNIDHKARSLQFPVIPEPALQSIFLTCGFYYGEKPSETEAIISLWESRAQFDSLIKRTRAQISSNFAQKPLICSLYIFFTESPPRGFIKAIKPPNKNISFLENRTYIARNTLCLAHCLDSQRSNHKCCLLPIKTHYISKEYIYIYFLHTLKSARYIHYL